MRVRGHELTYPRILLAALLVAVLAATIVGLTTSSVAFGAYNPTWDGTRALRGVADTTATTQLTQSTTAYDNVTPTETTALIISPDTTYSTATTARIRRFVTNGGTLLVAGDFQHTANSLLADLGASTRIASAPLRDPHHYYQAPSLPVATNISTTPLTTNVSRVTLNYPAHLDPGPNATTHVASSGYAYVDSNLNQALDSTETVASYPILASEPLGDGRVIVASDPSIFINAMLQTPDNHQLATNLFSDAQTVLFDYSHTTDIPPAIHLLLLVADSPWLQLLLALLALALITGRWTTEQLPATVRTYVTTEPAPQPAVTITQEDLVAGIARRHPEWDDDRIERVARRISQDTSRRNKDD